MQGSHRPGATVPRVSKVRLDSALAERGLFPSRSAAAASVRAGQVRIGPDGPIALKPGQMVEPGADLIVFEPPRFVSRGGVKLENALEGLGIDPAGRDCLDVGSSTGGFTDCLLQRGAARVVALDVGYGQLDARLRADARVTVMERRNARELEPGDLPFTPSLIVVDVSFISLAKLLGTLVACLAEEGELLAMVKPQFELGPGRVGKGGVVRSSDDRRAAVVSVADTAEAAGLSVRGFAPSGLPGPKGNRETFVWAAKGGSGMGDVEAALADVAV
jgi:23S rRNA (cytidine1920-2'-O)/16S rRNA (cytidine1409-2'-O)-methyltransferase